MKLLDSDVWIALVLSAHDHHVTASDWLLAQTSDWEVGFCRLTQIALLRLLTTKAVLSPYGNPPLTNEQAWQVYQTLVADRRISVLPEPPYLETRWKSLAALPSASPKLSIDAYLAAFALAGGHQLVTLDSAFKQFDGLDLKVLDRK